MRASVLAIVLAGLLMSIAAPATADDVSGPRFTVGDSWTYRTNTSLAAGFRLDGDVTLRVTALGSLRVEGISYEAVQMALSGAGTATGTFVTQFGAAPASGSWVLAGQESFETAGLKVVSSVLDLEASGSLHTQPEAIPFQLSVQNTTTYRLGDDAWRFPLAIGSSTVVVGEMNFSEDFRASCLLCPPPTRRVGRVSWNVAYAFEDQAVVDTPVGHFDAYRIRQTYPDGTYSVLFYAAAAGNYARTEAYNGTSQVGSSALTSYRYQALEAARLFGLTVEQWALAGVVGSVCVVAAVWWLGRRKKRISADPGPPPPPET